MQGRMGAGKNACGPLQVVMGAGFAAFPNIGLHLRLSRAMLVQL